jgi:hypothetical protein
MASDFDIGIIRIGGIFVSGKVQISARRPGASVGWV